MSAARAPRGRLMIVGNGTPVSLPPVDVPTVQVDTIYDALGTVTGATSREPVSLVLLRPERLPVTARRAADAIRKIDPAVRIALVVADPSANGDARDETPDASHFDAVLHMPIETERLERLLDGDGPLATASPPPPPAATSPAAEPVPAPAPTHAPEPPPRITTPVAPPVADDRELGDVDLVAAVLEDAGGLRDRALRLIVQQTGWKDLAFVEVDPDAEGDGDHERRGAGVNVVFEDRCFGRLTTDRARAADLMPWADWLARWLELDRSFGEHRVMAYRDDLTGAWNRRFFHAFLTETLERARALRRQITVMVFDIDNFKLYNDQFGHEAGDVVLIETVKLLNSVIRKGDRVCRIGGDEFAVIFADLEGPREIGSTHPATPERIAARFQDQICSMQFPKLGRDAPGPLSISAGLATYPWDGTTPDDLLRWADRRALQSKRKGKNAITLGPAAPDRGSCEEPRRR